MRTFNEPIKGYGLIILAATLWASQGVFYTQIRQIYGLPSFNAAFFRAIITALIIFAWLALRKQPPPRLSWRGVRFFALCGLFGVAMLYACFANAVDLVGIGIATVLMYTAPVWVTIISVLFMKEQWYSYKAVALLLVIGGVILVAQILQPGTTLNPTGLLWGLGAGLGYALYTLFNKVGLRDYEPLPLLGYSLIFGTLFMLPLQSPTVIIDTLTNPLLLLWLLMLSVVTTLGAAYCFVSGLQYLPASNASITSTLEPVIALFLGWFFFAEVVDKLQLLGAGMVLVAILLLNLKGQADEHQPQTGKVQQP
ncbi:DMT family transporter [Chloroflexota bacterium]